MYTGMHVFIFVCCSLVLTSWKVKFICIT